MGSYDRIPDFGFLYESVPLYAARSDISFYVEEGRRTREHILEVGCGTGRILLPLARAGARITGIDGSREMLARCQTKLDSEPAELRSRVALQHADVRRLDLGKRFALVIAPFRVFQHLTSMDDQLAALGAIARHLTPGGRLVFDVFNPSVYGDFDRSPLVDDSPEQILCAILD